MKTKTLFKVILVMSTAVLLSQCESETYAPTITTAPIINITQSTATSGGNVTDKGGSIVTARGVCWDTTPNPTVSSNTTNDGTGTGSFTSSIDGLTENTIYYVRAYATNIGGTAYGEELLFYSGIGILDQEQTTINYGFAVGSNLDGWHWQTFIPTLNNISAIELFIQTVSPTGTCTIRVQSEDGKLTYAEQTFSASLLPQFDWFKTEIISISAPPDTKYRIRISRSDTHTPDNAIYWRGNTDSNYPGYCNVNSSWENYDFAFKTYGFSNAN